MEYCGRQKPEIRGPEINGKIGDKDTHSEGHYQLGQYGTLHHLAHNEAVDQRAHDKHADKTYWNRKDGIDTIQGKEPEGGEHTEHQEFAVGEIHDVHDAPNKRQSDGDQGIHQTD